MVNLLRQLVKMHFSCSASFPIISVIVPVYNEESTLACVIEKILENAPYSFEVIIVDDCSTDKTNDIAKALANGDHRIKLFRHYVNCGKTAALINGFSQSKGDVIIVQDADLEYNPANIGQLVKPIVEGHADVVYGSRFLNRKNAPMVYFYQHAANRLLTAVSNAMTGLNISDVETGYKAFRGNIIRDIDIVSSGFGFEIEITAKIAKLGCPIREVPISYHGRTYAQGKKIGYRDFVSALWFIIYFSIFHDSRFFPRRYRLTSRANRMMSCK